MKQDMPVGIPFFLEKGPDGFFSHKLATDRKDYSQVSLDCFHWMAGNYVDANFDLRTDDYSMQTVINGEHAITHEGKKYRVDCVIRRPGEQDVFIEFNGCK